MAQKEERTAEEIRLLIQQAVDSQTRPAGSNVEIVIPTPQLLEEDKNGTNWEVPPHSGDKLYTEVVARAVRDAQAKYRLRIDHAE
ncbi:hypothetical protein [Bordetella genomosp. 13]|uniref:hypothetical protein n=1 Tax=Bordetella genomosp. 13 TaxID=463040 RepID=UPI0011A74A2B|nr:hypothetical protein [Bordetella genomosp. 13]